MRKKSTFNKSFLYMSWLKKSGPLINVLWAPLRNTKDDPRLQRFNIQAPLKPPNNLESQLQKRRSPISSSGCATPASARTPSPSWPPWRRWSPAPGPAGLGRRSRASPARCPACWWSRRTRRGPRPPLSTGCGCSPQCVGAGGGARRPLPESGGRWRASCGTAGWGQSCPCKSSIREMSVWPLRDIALHWVEFCFVWLSLKVVVWRGSWGLTYGAKGISEV